MTILFFELYETKPQKEEEKNTSIASLVYEVSTQTTKYQS